jgi:N-acetylglucosamine-6-phosphate deacetylase
MPALDHRKPGLIAALLTDPRLTIGIIPDGVHLHPKVVELAWKWAGPGRLNLVTDAMTALGMSAGKYRVGGLEVTVDEQVARLEDGRLAGSLLSLDRALRNLIAFTGCSLQEALATITSVPARLLGMGDRIGGIAPGMRADLVLLAEDLRVAWTMVGGQIIYPY